VKLGYVWEGDGTFISHEILHGMDPKMVRTTKKAVRAQGEANAVHNQFAQSYDMIGAMKIARSIAPSYVLTHSI